MVKLTNKNNVEALPDGFLEVSKRSGKLRLILVLVIFFFIWSFFALAASIEDPFPDLPSLWLSGRSGSANLADELFNEILSSYFSIFALAYSGFVLASVTAAFLLVKVFSSSTADLPESKPAGRFIKSCAFSTPGFPRVDLFIKDYEKTPEYDILNTFGGPCYLHLPAHRAAILQDKIGNFRLVTTVKPDGETFLLAHLEKLSTVIEFESKHTVAHFRTLCHDGRNIHIGKMSISSSIIFTKDNLLFSNDEKQYEKTIEEIARFTLGTAWQDFVDNRLRLEMGKILLNYSSREITGLLESDEKSAAADRELVVNRDTHRNHAISSHSQRYQLPAGQYRRSDKGIILRNRRRSIMPELRKQDEGQSKAEPYFEKKKDFRAVFSKQLEDAFNSIFTTPVIHFNIIKTGVISFDEVHKL